MQMSCTHSSVVYSIVAKEPRDFLRLHDDHNHRNKKKKSKNWAVGNNVIETYAAEAID